ncbi:Acetyl esterase/lipase [Chitinophaga costaii]|uniref:Acetyl esterase/lipase n=1 Tax=Chitinophaga costaii TaxID=1335309 RepID=A0A1C4FL53_9BACT|nr:alpha/beta hydrolase [Chitinophaga costaii]PUZ30584.1 alpha/beta hydrolase [Chitinophaga costaii]SCC56622.1 Acetyl esterase/lipase [Chitinophaga costaii]
MKKICFLLLLLTAFSAQAQQTFSTQKNIRYYPDALYRNDPYREERCTLDIYHPDSAKNTPVIIWFHGGSMTGGHKEIPDALLGKGYTIVGVGYRLSPHVKAPTYIEDAAAAIAWVFKHIREYGGNPDLIFLSGHSAGGYLDLMVGLDKHYLAKYDIDANRVAGLIPFSPQAITHFTVRAERGIRDTQPIIDSLAPLFHVRGDLPPLLLITGDREMEMLGRYEENAYLLRMMKLNGSKTSRLYELQGFDHGGMATPAFPLLLREVAAITKKRSL